MTTIDPNLSRYRVTQLVDLCKAREVGVATPTQDNTADSQNLCTTFQSLIHGGDAVGSAEVPPFGGVWGFRKPE